MHKSRHPTTVVLTMGGPCHPGPTLSLLHTGTHDPGGKGGQVALSLSLCLPASLTLLGRARACWGLSLAVSVSHLLSLHSSLSCCLSGTCTLSISRSLLLSPLSRALGLSCSGSLSSVHGQAVQGGLTKPLNILPCSLAILGPLPSTISHHPVIAFRDRALLQLLRLARPGTGDRPRGLRALSRPGCMWLAPSWLGWAQRKQVALRANQPVPKLDEHHCVPGRGGWAYEAGHGR